jgi:DNA-binding NarL/FixJ family response regulator
MTKLKSILVIDDHQIVFSGIQLIFHTSNLEFELQNCKNGDDAIDILRKTTFDLIIMDVNLPDTDTFQLLHLILGMHPDQKVLVFSMSSEEMYAKRFLKLGAMGYLSKHESNEEFVKAVHVVLNGERYLSKYMVKAMTNDALRGLTGNVFEKLSAREFEIMTYFLRGHGSKEVSNITQLHSSTIGTYKFKIFYKLGVKNVLELQELARVHRVIE